MKEKKDLTGLVPPHSIEIEKSLLGCILIDTTIMGKVSGLLSIDTFYHPHHQVIYEAMINLFKKHHPIDYVTLADELSRIGKIENAGGFEYIRDLTEVISASNYEVYARRLEEKAIGRRLISICNDTLSKVYDGSDDIFQVIGSHNDDIFKSQSSLSSHKNITPEFIGELLIKEMMAGMSNDGMIGVPYGVPEIDRMTGGKKAGQIITIGARTRHGKSAIAAGFMYNSSLYTSDKFGEDPNVKYSSKFPAGFLSMEMMNTEVFARLVSMEIKRCFKRHIPYSRIINGRLEQWQADLVVKAVDSLSKRGIYIDDTPALNTMMVKSKVMKMINDYGIAEVYIDYVQLITSDEKRNKTRAEQVSGWYTDFKNMAKFFGIPFIILSQVDRLTEKNGVAKPPVLSDLKESGGIEEKSDVVMLLYRHEVNNPMPTDQDGNSLRGFIQIDIAKQKNGDTGVMNIPFDVATNTFGDMDEFELPAQKKTYSQSSAFSNDDNPF